MSRLSLKLQEKSLEDMLIWKPYTKNLAGFEYSVFPKVYKGSTDTELFCKVLNVKKGQDVWDIGTGTGLIALATKEKGARYVLATDLNLDAVKNAKENSRILGLKIDVRQADVFGAINKKVDIITFNPPFTDHQPKQKHDISFWDKDNKTVRNFFRNLRKHLKPDGKAFIAWSSFGHVEKLKKIAAKFNFSLKEIGRKKGKRNFVYYVFEIAI